jgi:hypothetical protein
LLSNPRDRPVHELLVDPPLLVSTGVALSRVLPDDESVRAAEKVVVAVFLGVSIPLYLNAPWMRWMPRLLRSESGRDWMINSRVTSFEHRRPRSIVHLLAVAIFATYPWWYRLGARLGGRG